MFSLKYTYIQIFKYQLYLYSYSLAWLKWQAIDSLPASIAASCSWLDGLAETAAEAAAATIEEGLAFLAWGGWRSLSVRFGA